YALHLGGMAGGHRPPPLLNHPPPPELGGRPPAAPEGAAAPPGVAAPPARERGGAHPPRGPPPPRPGEDAPLLWSDEAYGRIRRHRRRAVRDQQRLAWADVPGRPPVPVEVTPHLEDGVGLADQRRAGARVGGGHLGERGGGGPVGPHRDEVGARPAD